MGRCAGPFWWAAACVKPLLDVICWPGLHLNGITYMMPPLDSLGPDHRIHRILDRLEHSPAARAGQTIVAAYTK